VCAKRTKDNAQDDSGLWAEVAKTITPANREDVLFTDPSIKAKAQKPRKSEAQKPLGAGGAPLKPAIKTNKTAEIRPDEIRPADLRSSVPVMRAGIDNASARRLTKGSFEIDERLDLHGKTEVMAHKALLQFVQRASRSGARTLLIITGKGAGGQGVLRRKVPEWLKEYPLKPHILAISQASPKDGGGGALYVRLRRSRDSDFRADFRGDIL
jgi:DNA-nicking Smr family endonuclease